MLEKMIRLLKENHMSVPKLLLTHYKELKITPEELVVIIYLLNEKTAIYNPKKISDELRLTFGEVLEIMSGLVSKNIISIELLKVNNVRDEYLNLDPIYQKLVFLFMEEEKAEEKESNLYSVFEQEFGRPLSPMEYEVIAGWLDGEFTEETILLALKEAVYNGVSHLRYIDKILYSWKKKGIKTKEDVEKDREGHQKRRVEAKEDVFEYDWLNDQND